MVNGAKHENDALPFINVNLRCNELDKLNGLVKCYSNVEIYGENFTYLYYKYLPKFLINNTPHELEEDHLNSDDSGIIKLASKTSFVRNTIENKYSDSNCSLIINLPKPFLGPTNCFYVRTIIDEFNMSTRPKSILCSSKRTRICECKKRSNGTKSTPDVYRSILGPTPDESILAGLQTVIDMCGILENTSQAIQRMDGNETDDGNDYYYDSDAEHYNISPPEPPSNNDYESVDLDDPDDSRCRASTDSSVRFSPVEASIREEIEEEDLSLEITAETDIGTTADRSISDVLLKQMSAYDNVSEEMSHESSFQEERFSNKIRRLNSYSDRNSQWKATPERSRIRYDSDAPTERLSSKMIREGNALSRRPSPERSKTRYDSDAPTERLSSKMIREGSALSKRPSPERSRIRYDSDAAAERLSSKMVREGSALSKRPSPERSRIRYDSDAATERLSSKMVREGSALSKRPSPERSRIRYDSDAAAERLSSKMIREGNALSRRPSPEKSKMRYDSDAPTERASSKIVREGSSLSKRPSPERSRIRYDSDAPTERASSKVIREGRPSPERSKTRHDSDAPTERFPSKMIREGSSLSKRPSSERRNSSFSDRIAEKLRQLSSSHSHRLSERNASELGYISSKYNIQSQSLPQTPFNQSSRRSLEDTITKSVEGTISRHRSLSSAAERVPSDESICSHSGKKRSNCKICLKKIQSRSIADSRQRSIVSSSTGNVCTRGECCPCNKSIATANKSVTAVRREKLISETQQCPSKETIDRYTCKGDCCKCPNAKRNWQNSRDRAPSYMSDISRREASGYSKRNSHSSGQHSSSSDTSKKQNDGAAKLTPSELSRRNDTQSIVYKRAEEMSDSTSASIKVLPSSHGSNKTIESRQQQQQQRYDSSRFEAAKSNSPDDSVKHLSAFLKEHRDSNDPNHAYDEKMRESKQSHRLTEASNGMNFPPTTTPSQLDAASLIESVRRFASQILEEKHRSSKDLPRKSKLEENNIIAEEQEIVQQAYSSIEGTNPLESMTGNLSKQSNLSKELLAAIEGESNVNVSLDTIPTSTTLTITTYDAAANQEDETFSIGQGDVPLVTKSSQLCVRYACVKITEYDDYSTYEVLNVPVRPPKGCATVHGVFVAKKTS